MPAQDGRRAQPRPRARARAPKPWPGESYRLLFEQNPQPMWVWDRETCEVP